ncbi:diadenylate cyclase CdaA [Catenisphaera adipataccumulans]|uniref:Diadenylate cyclase n=1 Tax=Catenisphaera adipataccumulans TaxID=700500 RepID=A0A7W8FVM4_9FIRM|nr:diadenylate cyclase CdaA [Catenisphaera adipataccumulans]MBB5183774.1 diadenylate cyclase [Catenisphaera adipataccumulans]
MELSISDVPYIIRWIVDILVLWGLIYAGLRLVRNNTRTIQIFKGVIILLIVKGLSVLLGLNALSYIMNLFLQWGVVAIIIVFQPEIRGVLEKLGRTSSPLHWAELTNGEYEHMINELVEACDEMSRTKTGALITIQQTQQLTDYVNTGIRMDSVVSAELLQTIFQYGTPMHDGAVIIQGNKIACAAAYFPPTTKDLPSKYGARHRAAVGISEITDSITIVVSEETGAISVAVKGQLIQYPAEGLRRYLKNMLIDDTVPVVDNTFFKTARNFSISRSKKTDKKSKPDDRILPISVVDLYNDKQGGKKNGKTR